MNEQLINFAHFTQKGLSSQHTNGPVFVINCTSHSLADGGRAFAGISPRQIASIKIAKLLSAIASNKYMASAVPDKNDDLPQVDQCETARKKAIRMEREMMVREQICQQASVSDKKGDEKWSGDNVETQQDAQLPKSHYYPMDNRNRFNSPI
ncbi:unnamed protein product [Caenorhabditis nigoni]